MNRIPVVPRLPLIYSLLSLAIRFALFWTLLVAALIFGQRMLPLFRNVPEGIRYACAGLIFITAALMWHMLRQRVSAAAEIGDLRRTIAILSPFDIQARRSGRETADIENLRGKAGALTGHAASWWSAIDDSLVFYRWANGDKGWFTDRRADEILPVEEVVSASYHQSFHQTVPAIITSLGLLTTFTAILIALAGVSYDAQASGAPVRGIDTLINGLAGKFLSSIVALILSVSFTLIEKLFCERGLQTEYELLTESIRRRIPVLRPIQMLADISSGRREQIPRTEEDFEDPAH